MSSSVEQKQTNKQKAIFKKDGDQTSAGSHWPPMLSYVYIHFQTGSEQLEGE